MKIEMSELLPQTPYGISVHQHPMQYDLCDRRHWKIPTLGSGVLLVKPWTKSRA
jgi:hypothetical protein